MGQVTLYLDEKTEELIKIAAKSSGVSQSKWVARIIREKAANEWPPEFIALAGAWSKDFPTAEKIRELQSTDTAREPF